MSPETTQRLIGGAMAAGGTVATMARDSIAGLSIPVITSALLGLSGGFLLAWPNIKKILDAIRQDRRDAREADAKAALKIEAARHRARIELEEEWKSSLSGQIEMMRAEIAELTADRKADLEIARQRQEGLQAALDLSNENQKQLNENYQRLRKTSHEANNRLQVLANERASLEAQLNDARVEVERANAQLARLGVTAQRQQEAAVRTEEKVDTIAHAVVKMSDSQHEMSTSLAPTPDPDAPPMPR